MRLEDEILALREQLIHHRRYLHKYPETDLDVVGTRYYIVNQ